MAIHNIESILLVDILFHLHIVHLKVVPLVLNCSGLMSKVTQLAEHQLLLSLHVFSHLTKRHVVPTTAIRFVLGVSGLEIWFLRLRRALVGLWMNCSFR